MTDPRAVVEYRVPATDLRVGDLVNTSPGEDDWQEVVGVFTAPGDARSDEIRGLIESVAPRYVVVQLTDLAPVDGGIYFDGDGKAMIYGEDEGDDPAVADTVSTDDGIRTYLYTRFELVTVRSAGA